MFSGLGFRSGELIQSSATTLRGALIFQIAGTEKSHRLQASYI
jgi:hypothetical protein